MTRTILLADDSVTIQKVVELTFMDQDYQIDAVSDGSAAVARLPENKPDLLIADVHMPGADGYEVCRRSKEIHPDVPVLLLVGTFEHFDDEAAAAAGADSHLKKPFDSQDLLHQVEALISRAGRPAATDPPDAGAGTEVPAQALPAMDLEPPGLTDEEVTSVSQAAFELTPAPAAPQEPATGIPFPLATGTGQEAAAPAAETTFDAWGVEIPAAKSSAFESPAAEPPPEPSAWETEAMEAWGEPPSDEEPTAAEPAMEAPPLEAPILEETPDMEPAAMEPAPEAPVAEQATAAEPPPEKPAAVEDDAEPAAEAAPAEAPGDTAAEAPSAEAPSAEAAIAVGANGLSDDDVDRVARKVIELAGDKALREVAWDVVPDLAEVIIKERIRELESQVE